MAISKRTWESTRPPECKQSGIGKAIDAWNAYCKPPLQLKDTAALDEASSAAQQLAKAIQDARSKLSPVKSTNPQKKSTEALLDEWDETVSRYEKALIAETDRVAKQMEQKYQIELKAMMAASHDVLDYLGTASASIVSWLVQMKKQAQKVGEGLDAAMEAKSAGNAAAAAEAAKATKASAEKLVESAATAKTTAKKAADYQMKHYTFRDDFARRGDGAKLDRIHDHISELQGQIETNIKTLDSVVAAAEKDAAQTDRLPKKAADLQKFYVGQCDRLVSRLFDWSQERDVAARECGASETNGAGDLANYQADADPKARAEHLAKAHANYTRAEALYKEFNASVQEQEAAYTKARAALPAQIVHDGSPVFNPLLTELGKGYALLIEDRNKAKDLGERVQKLAAKLQKIG